MAKFKKKSDLISWIYIAINPIILSLLPLIILWVKFGFYKIYLLIPILGLTIGIFWAENVRKKGRFDDYEGMKLFQTPDLIETWEKEKTRKEEFLKETFLTKGVLDEFETAVKNKNVEKVINILKSLEFKDLSIEEILKQYDLEVGNE